MNTTLDKLLRAYNKAWNAGDTEGVKKYRKLILAHTNTANIKIH